MSTFKVLQFNMQFGQVWDEADPDHAPIRFDETIAEIQSHAADIIMLQEVENAQPGGSQPPIPPNYSRLCSELPGYDGFFSFPRSDPRELPFGIGLAIFSRTPLRDTMRRYLPAAPITFDFFGEKTMPTDRLMIGAKTTVFGRDLQLFNTHLQAFFMIGSSSENHPQQRNEIEKHLRASTIPTILTGDFNVSRHESLVRQYAAAGYQTVQQTEITWRRQPYVLDHIFYNAPLRAVRHLVKPTPVSDHHALVAEFEFT